MSEQPQTDAEPFYIGWQGETAPGLNFGLDRILHNMSLLMERSFASVQELNRYRKEVTAAVAARARPTAA